MKLAGFSLEQFIESMIFFPDPILEAVPGDIGLAFEDEWFDTTDGVHLNAWMVPAKSPEALLLFCHGNAGNISHRLDNIQRLIDIDVSVFIFDYRGYGRSGGRISEAGFYRDSEAAYRVAREYADKEGLKLVIFGRSLGGIAAVHLAAQYTCSGVILESTFPHLGVMASEHFPIPLVGGLLKDRLNSVDKIGRITAPILFFHGDLDDIVPYRCGLELFDAAPSPKEFVAIPGAGHNDTYLVAGTSYFDRLRQFIRILPPSDRLDRPVG
jgi:uncharacterized protein